MTGIQITHYPGHHLEARLTAEPSTPPTVGGSDRPHGMRTITSFDEGWDTIRVIGEVRPVDIPSLKASALSALVRRPVRLVIDLSEMTSCVPEGVQWILETRQRAARCGGELKVVLRPDWPTASRIEFDLIE